MTLAQLALRSLSFYRRTNAASIFGVASAVAVLAGSLLVGSSVRASLASIASSRLGQTHVVIASENLFTEQLQTRLLSGRTTLAPMLMFKGIAIHDTSGRRARDVQVYGIDGRFFAFHGVNVKPPGRSDALLSPDLADELGAAAGDSFLVRVARPTDIPLDSLHGRREDLGRSVRLQVRSTLAREQMGEFSLTPQQGRARAVFVSLERLQHDVDPPPAEEPGRPAPVPPKRINALLVAPAAGAAIDAAGVRTALAAAIEPEDLGLKVSLLPATGEASSGGERHGTTTPTLLVETSSGMLNDAAVEAVEAAAARASLEPTRVLTWLANRMTIGDRSVPYSLVTAIGPTAAGDAQLARLLAGPTGGPNTPPPIVLNEWAARDLKASNGDTLEIEYYRWIDEGRLTTARASFTVAGIVPMTGLATDRRLAPDYPGITTSTSVTDWDPPFPIDLTLVRPLDEDYWRQHRTAPKAFLPLAAGQELWRTRHGQVTSIRLQPQTAGISLDDIASRLAAEVTRAIPPDHAGFTVVDVRAQQTAASVGATDFGAYFSYFSFFLMVSALLLAALFFRLGIEQRLAQAGILRAIGFSLAHLRRLFLIEGAFLSVAGGVLGVMLAVAWAGLMMYGLRTWWVGAVGTTLLRLHIDPAALLIGAAGALVAAVVSIAITVRGLARPTPRALLAGTMTDPAPRRNRILSGMVGAISCFVVAVALTVLSFLQAIPPAAGFFGAGMLVLAAGLFATSSWLRHISADRVSNFGSKGPSLRRLAMANASWRPGRTVTSVGLVAAAVFLLVSVDAFRKGGTSDASRSSGTGGFALIAESSLPIVNDISTPDGRAALGFDASADRPLEGVALLPLRLRPGDDASCLNLYQPRRPRIVGVPPAFVEGGRFRFARSLASTDADHANPWRLLSIADRDGIVPAIVDQTSLQYVLHAAVGDVLTLDEDTTRPFRVRVVASLDDSMLQGEILVAERAFVDLFPDAEGYRLVLAEIPGAAPARVDEVARLLEERLEPFGLDAEDTVKRLEAYHRVENTYLSTFQALGALGLVLGCFGLLAITARNVLERRRELALLGAAGFRGSQLQALVVTETAGVIVSGLAIGVAAAAVAIGPVLAARGTLPSTLPLVALGLVAIVGVVAAIGATRNVRKLPLVPSLRSE